MNRLVLTPRFQRAYRKLAQQDTNRVIQNGRTIEEPQA